ncbi:DUF58 domain-containing protein [Thauera humireducens]|uniref:DUF58 domain-containing protein n=1 Tax=Thauera humireducens TaxID=1134435 RepID=UPI002467A820|nr:DUF58 domain-containing protein [Thauera humireducens]CAH1745291.1 DUF58 domain-containing protein [Thauera humireducens]
MRGQLDRWLFRLGAPERGPIELVQRRIYVLPSRAGLVFAVALVVMLLASINYGLSLGYGLVFLLSGAGIASILHAYRNLLGLRLRPGRCEPVFCGETASFRLVVENARATRRPALCLRLGKQRTAFELAPGETHEVPVLAPTHRRGLTQPGRMVLETYWPLGLIRAWTVFVPDMPCVVYPAPEGAPPPLPPEGEAEGRGRAASRPGDDDFAGLRAHQRADSPRHIAWKVLARGGPLLTKQFSGEAGGDLSLDWAQLPAQLDTEARLSRLTAWLLAAERSGRRYALRLPRVACAAGHGHEHLHRCLRELALHGAGQPENAR